MGITGTHLSTVHGSSNNPSEYLKPSRLEIYLDPEQRANVAKPRFGNPQHANVSTTNAANDSDLSIKPAMQNKRLAYGDNFTHFPNI